MQIASAREEEGCAALPFELFLKIGQAAEGVPSTMFRILDGQDAIRALPFDLRALLANCNDPRIMTDEIGAVAAIGADLPRGLSRIRWAEEDDELMTGEARWVDNRAGWATEIDYPVFRT